MSTEKPHGLSTPLTRLRNNSVRFKGPTSCACCGGARLSKLGEDIAETLEVIPKSWKVIQSVREKFSRRDCEKIIQARRHSMSSPAVGPVIAFGLPVQRLMLAELLEQQVRSWKPRAGSMPDGRSFIWRRMRAARCSIPCAARRWERNDRYILSLTVRTEPQTRRSRRHPEGSR